MIKLLEIIMNNSKKLTMITNIRSNNKHILIKKEKGDLIR
jgi:hypothetical protein